MKGKKDSASGVIINDHIRDRTMQVITQDGENIGIVSRDQALRMAQEAGLDLVKLADRGKEGVPVTKIMDHGKVLYERKKKQVEAKKHQKTIQVKEVKIRPKIGEHDYNTKMKHAIQFLNAGKRVKITLFFRGRENISKQERGKEIFDRVTKTLEQAGFQNQLIQEKDAREGQFWSRIYFLKSAK